MPLARGNIFNHLPGISLRLDVNVKHEARLGTASAFPVGTFWSQRWAMR
jgi:hypothetical protein